MDGSQKHVTKLAQKPHIWSSSTLYTEEMKQLRKEWFSDWILENPAFLPQEIIKFHKDEAKGEIGTSLKMKRPFVETVSITSVEKTQKKTTIKYIDFVNDVVSVIPAFRLRSR